MSLVKIRIEQMYDLFYVESPLQLMSAIEARKIATNKTVLILNLADSEREAHNKQTQALLNTKDWYKVHLYKTSKYKYVNTVQTILKTLFLHVKYRKRTERYFFGEFRSLAMAILSRSLRPQKSILLDDGAFTIAAQLKFIRNNLHAFDYQNIEGRILGSLLGIDYTIQEAPSLYSFFDFTGMLLDGQVNYHQPKLKTSPETDSEVVYYFGSKFSEAGILREVDELRLAENLIAKHTDKRCYYLPHRDEKQHKLDALAKLGFNILSLGKPAEVYFDETEKMPGMIVSCYSTVLYSCYSRFNNVQLTALDIRPLISNQLIRENASYVYDYYQQLGIPVINSN